MIAGREFRVPRLARGIAFANPLRREFGSLTAERNRAPACFSRDSSYGTVSGNARSLPRKLIGEVTGVVGVHLIDGLLLDPDRVDLGRDIETSREREQQRDKGGVSEAAQQSGVLQRPRIAALSAVPAAVAIACTLADWTAWRYLGRTDRRRGRLKVTAKFPIDMPCKQPRDGVAARKPALAVAKFCEGCRANSWLRLTITDNADERTQIRFANRVAGDVVCIATEHDTAGGLDQFSDTERGSIGRRGRQRR